MRVHDQDLSDLGEKTFTQLVSLYDLVHAAANEYAAYIDQNGEREGYTLAKLDKAREELDQLDEAISASLKDQRGSDPEPVLV